MARHWFAPKGGPGFKPKEYGSIGVLEIAYQGKIESSKLFSHTTLNMHLPDCFYRVNNQMAIFPKKRDRLH